MLMKFKVMDRRIIMTAMMLAAISCRGPLQHGTENYREAIFNAIPADSFSKAEGKSSWTGDGTELISFTLTQGGVSSTGIYKVADAMGKTVAVTPAYWQSTSAVANVKAIYPSSVTESTFNISDQSSAEKLLKCDFLTASATGVTFGSALNLQFTHAMSRINIVLTAGTGVDLSKITQIKVLGTLYAVWTDGALTGSSIGYIKACKNSDSSYEALVVPGEIHTPDFIRIDIEGGKDNGGKTYIYNPAIGSPTTLAAGNSYTYNITVGAI